MLTKKNKQLLKIHLFCPCLVAMCSKQMRDCFNLNGYKILEKHEESSIINRRVVDAYQRH